MEGNHNTCPEGTGRRKKERKGRREKGEEALRRGEKWATCSSSPTQPTIPLVGCPLTSKEEKGKREK